MASVLRADTGLGKRAAHPRSREIRMVVPCACTTRSPN